MLRVIVIVVSATPATLAVKFYNIPPTHIFEAQCFENMFTASYRLRSYRVWQKTKFAAQEHSRGGDKISPEQRSN